MNDQSDIEQLQALKAFLSKHRGEFQVTNARKLLFPQTSDQIQNEISAIGLNFALDVDGIIVKLSDWLPTIQIIWRDWIDQDLDVDNVYQPIAFLDTTGEFVLAKNGVLLFATHKDLSDNIWSAVAHYRILLALKTDSISDHHNQAKKEIVFYSSTRGVIRIVYNPIAPLNIAIHQETVKELIEIISTPHYKIHFVNGLFKIAGDKPLVQLSVILANASDLLQMIKRDYEITIKQFDFEKFKDSLLKEKDKYFATIREIINKIHSQLIGIPISISASAFATYKVNEEPFTLILIALGFLFYLFLYVKIQLGYRTDLKDLRMDFLRDFKIIRDKSGLESAVIEIEEKKVFDKINRTRSLIAFMVVGIIVLGLSFILYLVDQLIHSLYGLNLAKAFLRLVLSCTC